MNQTIAVATPPRSDHHADQTMQSYPRVCVVDSFVSERGKQALPTQGALLAKYFTKEGMVIIKTSSHVGKLTRALDMAATLMQRSSEFDVALIQLFGQRAFHYGRLTSWIAKRLHKRVVLVLRGGMLPSDLKRRPKQVKDLFHRADVIVAPSSYMASVFCEAGFTVRIIPNFIEIERYQFRLRERVKPRLFWVRAFHYQYNPQMAIEVLGLLKKQFPDARLSMGGLDSGELENCRKLAASLGVTEGVRFLGFLSKQQIFAEAAGHDIHLHTNRIDNMPVTLLENMALGLPIAATRVGGVPHLVQDEKTALLVESDDAPAMAAAVTRLLMEPQLAAALSRAGRQFVEEKFTWAAIRDDWFSVLRGN